jgi:hypothetical protein
VGVLPGRHPGRHEANAAGSTRDHEDLIGEFLEMQLQDRLLLSNGSASASFLRCSFKIAYS